MAQMEELSRQRMDYSTGPRGETVATLTVTLGDGSVHRYKGTATEPEVNKLAKGIANAEMRKLQVSGEIAGWSEDEISGLFGKIFKGVKKVGKVARKIASSKAFKMAGKGLLAASPMLGPFAPAAAAVGGGMMVASKISDASIAAEAGAKRTARSLGLGAKRTARGMTRRRSSFSKLMRWANAKRKAVMARAAGGRWAPPQQYRRPAPQRSRAYWQQKRRLQAALRRAQRPRPPWPRYATPQYARPAYVPPWAAQQRALPMAWQR